MKFNDWLADFVVDKKELPSSESDTAYSVHDIRRFIDQRNRIWEIAFTYTGRLVLRSGSLAPDGKTIRWEAWSTQHDVELQGKP